MYPKADCQRSVLFIPTVLGQYESLGKARGGQNQSMACEGGPLGGSGTKQEMGIQELALRLDPYNHIQAT